jgi:23S rRNA-/tRNA-specific pseudouridylate synthase
MIKNPIPDLENRIIYEKDGLLVFNKPHDIPTSGKDLDDHDSVQYWLIKRAVKMVWAVHQLDADTTGVNIFVTDKKLVGKWQKKLSLSSTFKRYIAIVYGSPSWSEIDERSPIGKVDSRSLGVCAEGKSAHSKFKVLKRGEKFSLIEARIFTGRTHQIRIHLAHLGHSLVGEEWYGDKPCELHPRQLLHAREIVFEDGDRERFVAEVAEDFVKFEGEEIEN